MPELRIAFLGDVVGAAGRRAVAHAWPKLRDLHAVHALIVNGENARNGSGCSPDNYKELRRSGVDAVTLGDHVFKDRSILEMLEDPRQPISRPANLSAGAPGKRIIQLELPEKAGMGSSGVKAGTRLGEPGYPEEPGYPGDVGGADERAAGSVLVQRDSGHAQWAEHALPEAAGTL